MNRPLSAIQAASLPSPRQRSGCGRDADGASRRIVCVVYTRTAVARCCGSVFRWMRPSAKTWPLRISIDSPGKPTTRLTHNGQLDCGRRNAITSQRRGLRRAKAERTIGARSPAKRRRPTSELSAYPQLGQAAQRSNRSPSASQAKRNPHSAQNDVAMGAQEDFSHRSAAHLATDRKAVEEPRSQGQDGRRQKDRPLDDAAEGFAGWSGFVGHNGKRVEANGGRLSGRENLGTVPFSTGKTPRIPF